MNHADASEMDQLRALLHQQRTAKLRALNNLIRLKQELKTAKEQAHELDLQLQALLSSRSWKLTQPMRNLRRAIRPHQDRTKEKSQSSIVHDAPVQPAEPHVPTRDENAPHDSKIIPDDKFLTSGREEWDRVGLQRLGAFLTGEHRLAFPEVSRPQLSVVIVLYNNAHLTFLCLQSILNNIDISLELILIDNGSTDQTANLLQRLRQVRVIQNEQNLGFGYACVQGVENSRGEYICFLNNDAILRAGSLRFALQDFAEDSTIGALGGKILLANGSLQEAGSMVWRNGVAWGYGRGDPPELPRYNFRRPVDYCSGVFLLTPRSLFNDLGGFDPIFLPAYYEDADYCFKVWHKGRKVIYEPRAVIHHYESASQESIDMAKGPIAAQRSKFVNKWMHQLQRHACLDGARIPSARFAVQAGGLQILCLNKRVPLAERTPEEERLKDTVTRLSAKGHHVTLVSMSYPIEESDLTHFLRDIELVDGSRAAHYVFRELVSQYDVVWVRGARNMHLFLGHMENMHDGTPRIIYELGELASSSSTALTEQSVNTTSADWEDMRTLCAAADIVIVASAIDRTFLLNMGIMNVQLVDLQSIEGVITEMGVML